MAKTDSTTEAPVEKKELPLDIFSDTMPGEEELPLDGEVVEKEYATHTEEAPATGSTTTTTPPPPPPTSDGYTTPPPPPSSAPGTAAVPPKSPEQVRSEAEQLVDMLLKGYEKLHGLGRWAGKVDNTELVQEHLAGKINLDQELPLGRKTVTVKEFFHDYNSSIDENIVVEDEFRDNIKPPMIRIAIKRGWALGDEMYVGMLLGEDLATKASMLIGLKKSANLVLAACHELMKKQNAPNDPPPADEKREGKKEDGTKEQPEDVPFTETSSADEWREETNTETPPTP